jgi:hypothetical protein
VGERKDPGNPAEPAYCFRIGPAELETEHGGPGTDHGPDQVDRGRASGPVHELERQSRHALAPGWVEEAPGVGAQLFEQGAVSRVVGDVDVAPVDRGLTQGRMAHRRFDLSVPAEGPGSLGRVKGRLGR